MRVQLVKASGSCRPVGAEPCVFAGMTFGQQYVKGSVTLELSTLYASAVHSAEVYQLVLSTLVLASHARTQLAAVRC
jgi:hypothetical protein